MTRSAWIPYAFVAGFAVVLSANGALIYAATRQSVHLVVEKPYERGLAYNQLLDEKHRQEALGWQVAAEMDHSVLTVSAAAPGKDFSDATAEVLLQRPIEGDSIGPFMMPLVQGKGSVPIEARPGQWAVHITLKSGGDHLVTQQRLVLK